jgi:HD-GYP domain-containing protein (c-di-GMP phosphodiesterase class II)
VCGSWIDHPFWKSSFKLDDARQLRQLQSSRVTEVIIDTRRGLDVLDPAVEEAPASGQSAPPADDQAPPTEPEKEPALSPVLVEPVRLSFEDEFDRAHRIVFQARGAMKSMFQDARMGKAIDAEHCLPVVEEIAQSVARNPGAIVSLARLKTSDDYTYMHSVAVCALMVSLAHQLKLNESDTREAGMAGLVHDLGKSAMPLEVLNKPGKLTEAEYAIMRSHPEAGHRMLLEAKGVGAIPLDVCLHHHEKVNGTGYPHRLKGEDISLFARMGAVCDVYDAITSNRPYKSGWDPAESIQKMAQWSREGHFDDLIFQAFVRSIGIYPTGSLVKLQSGRLAVVVDQSPTSLLKPIVKAFFSTKANEPITPELIDLSRSTEQIVSREMPATWGFKNLNQIWMPATTG